MIGYYLANREAVDAYLEQSEREGDAIQREMEARWPPHGLRAKLLARLEKQAVK